MEQQNVQTTKDNIKKKDGSFQNIQKKIKNDVIDKEKKKNKTQNEFYKKNNNNEENILNNEDEEYINKKLYNLIIYFSEKKKLLYFFKIWCNYYSDKVFEYDGKKAFKNMKKIQNDKNLEIKHNDEFNDDDLINNKSRNKYKDIIDNKEIKDYKNKNIYYSKNNKNFANTDYKNVINKHFVDKSSRYKNNLFHIKKKEENVRLSFSNMNDEINADKYNKKLINLLNIKRCHCDKLMIFFDKWFEKTYQNELIFKKINKRKKIKKKKYIDKKGNIIDNLEDNNDLSSNSYHTSNIDNKSYDNKISYSKTGEFLEKIIKKNDNNEKRNNLNTHTSYDHMPVKNNKRNLKKSFGQSEDKIRRNSHNFKIKNIFKKLNKNNLEGDESINNPIVDGIILLFNLIYEHEKRDIIKIYKNIFKKMINNTSKNNSSENIIKYRRKKGQKYSAKLKLKKIINKITKSQNDNMIFTVFNRWRDNKLVNNNIYKIDNNNNKANLNNGEIDMDQSLKGNNKEHNISENESISYKEKNANNKINIYPIEKNFPQNSDEDSDKELKNNRLKEININKVTENKIEKKKKIYFHVTNNKNTDNNMTKPKEEDKNENEKQILGQISVKAQPPSQIINRGLPTLKKDNQINNNKNNQTSLNEPPLLRKKYYEDKSNYEKEMSKRNNEIYNDDNDNEEKDSFEEELRKSQFKNLAINDFIGTMVKKADMSREPKFNFNNINNKFKDNNNFIQDKKQKIQPPKQVLEFQAKRKNINNHNNFDIFNFRDSNNIIKKENVENKNKSNHQAKGRKIKRYYYREMEKKGETQNEKEKEYEKDNDNEKENKRSRIRYPYKRINNYNNKKKLNNLINKIDSLKNKNYYFIKWKNFINYNQEEPNVNNINNENEDNNINININVNNINEDNTLKLISESDNISSQKNIDYEFNTSSNNKKPIFILENQSSIGQNSFHSEITEIESREDKFQSYNKIKELTEYNKKLLDNNLSFFKKKLNNSDIYLSLLIKNIKMMTIPRIFGLYSVFYEKNKSYMIRNIMNKWKEKSKCFNLENEDNIQNNNINDKSDNNAKILMLKNIVTKYKFMKENNPKKYYFNFWITKINL